MSVRKLFQIEVTQNETPPSIFNIFSKDFFVAFLYNEGQKIISSILDFWVPSYFNFWSNSNNALFEFDKKLEYEGTAKRKKPKKVLFRPYY